MNIPAPRILLAFSQSAVRLRRIGALSLSLAMLPIVCSCSTSQPPFEGDPMPEAQVTNFLEVITPSGRYDAPPKFVKGYAPFFPSEELSKREWGYAKLQFVVTPDGSVSDIRVVVATAADFALEAADAVKDWKFAPARKNGQPVAVRVRLPFTFRT
jgi:TonB family protein